MKQSTMNLLFLLGVLIPALITVVLFLVFCYCWYKIRIRNQILYKKHDPHKIEQLGEGQIYAAPPPPPPPFRSPFSELENYNNNNDDKNKEDGNYEESPEPTEGVDNVVMYRTAPDSGFSDLNHIHCDLDKDSVGRDQAAEKDRPSSQASDDSDDSGFRSSRSGQYLHSASSSAGNAQETCPGAAYHMRDAVPLFQPIKVHPNEHGQPTQAYVHRNSSKHKRHKHRNPVPSSQHYNSDIHNLNTNSVSLAPQVNIAASQMHASGHLGPYYDLNSASKSNCDVHGGKLHSINSHVRPLHSIGNFGHLNSDGHCDHSHSINSFYTDNHLGQLNSIGYGSDLQSLNYRHSLGYGPLESTGHPHMDPISHISFASPITGYNPIQKTDLDLNVQKLHPLRTIPEMPLTITQAMVHRPYIEELSDPSLFSVV